MAKPTDRPTDQPLAEGSSGSYGCGMVKRSINRSQWVARRVVKRSFRHGPVVRNSDPASSHLGARVIEPKRGSRRRQVLDRLRESNGGWVPGYEMSTAECGGSEGTRRFRELRAAGWPVEGPELIDGVFQYRLPVNRQCN
jgi:hypothetical protein